MYIYQADIYCDSCGRKLRAENPNSYTPNTPEHMYDSDEYPKGPYPEEATDSVQHCALGANCEEAENLNDGSLVGAIINTELTEEGVRNLEDFLRRVSTNPEYRDEYRLALAQLYLERFADYVMNEWLVLQDGAE